MTTFPASGDKIFSSFREAYLWAQSSEAMDFEGPSIDLNLDLKDEPNHRYQAWRFFWAVEKVINEGWSLLATPASENWRDVTSVLTYDKEKDWLIAFDSKNKFEKVSADEFNFGIKVAEFPKESLEESLGVIPKEPASYEDTLTWNVDKWYDSDGDFLYGDEIGNIKTTLKSFLDSLGDFPNIFFVKVNLPTDGNIRAINWFVKAFSQR